MTSSMLRDVSVTSVLFFVAMYGTVWLHSESNFVTAYGSENTCKDGEVCPNTNSKQQLEDPCRDHHEKCEFWASVGECTNNPKYMKKHCLVSCKECVPGRNDVVDDDSLEEDSSSSGVTCEDLHEMCKYWAEQGECMINPVFMESACKMSCYKCVNNRLSVELDENEELISRKRIFSKMDIGVQQNIPNGKEHEDTKAVIRKMDKYAKEIVTLPENSHFRPKCKNNNVQCAAWASVGECTRVPEFMIKECPLACYACDKLEQIDRCKTTKDKEEFEFFPKGSINKLFEEGIIKNENLKQFSPEIIASPTSSANPGDPWMIRFDSFLSDEEVNHIVRLGDEIGWKASTLDKVDNDNGSSVRRVSKSAICDQRHNGICDSDDVFQKVMSRIAEISSVSTLHFEHVELVKYSYRGLFELHHDYRVDDKWKPAGPRVLSFLLGLSDVEEGGAIGFPEMDWLYVLPKKGQALVWSNVLDSDPREKHPKMIHETLPVVQGELITAQIWVHREGWRSEFARGCA